MLKFIYKHKGLSILMGLCLILFIIILFIFAELIFFSGNGAYNGRLDGIEDVKLEKSFLKEIQNDLLSNENIEKASVRLQGKIVYIEFFANNELSVDSAKDISASLLEKFSEEELRFYDICYIVTWSSLNEDGEEVFTVIEGTKHPLKESISW